jgi:hypothetical protein
MDLAIQDYIQILDLISTFTRLSAATIQTD